MTTPHSPNPTTRTLSDAPLIVEDLLLQAEERLGKGDRAEARQLLDLALRISAGEA